MQLVGGAGGWGEGGGGGGRGEGAVAFGAVELGSDKVPDNHSSAFRLVIRQSTIVALRCYYDALVLCLIPILRNTPFGTGSTSGRV